MNSIKLGLVLISISIIIACLFFIDIYHTLYWKHPAIFITLTIIGIFSATFGGYLIGRNLPNVKNPRVLPIVSIAMGALIAVVGSLWVLITVFAAIGTRTASGDQWRHLEIFIPLIVVGVFLAIYGGYWISRNLPIVKKNTRVQPVFSIALGSFFALVGGLSGLGAIFLAIGIWTSTGYWGETFYGYGGYGGDYMFLGMQIMALQICILFGIIGYFLIGLGFGQQKLKSRVPDMAIDH